MDDHDTPSPPASGSVDKPRGHRSVPGMNGNPNGRPQRSRYSTTVAMDAVLEDAAERLARTAVEKALDGDPLALRLCLERILRRDRRIAFDLPEVVTAADAVKASCAILTACAAGILSPNEGVVVMGLIKSYVRSLETAEIEARLTDLERRLG